MITPPRTVVRATLALLLILCASRGMAADVAPSVDKVSLVESTIKWSTYDYALDSEGGFIGSSFNGKTIVDRTFKTWVLENRYLKVILLPEFGGRILSIVYKPTGHEQLYRTEVGVPFGIKSGNFYFDWLIVYGGIFATLPTPEHGKTWFKPWEFKIVKQTPQEVTVTMSFKDDIEFAAPRRFKGGATGIEATYYISLKAGRTAVDARMLLKNPNDSSLNYEYWTCTTFAPGSDPQKPKATAGAEIVAPISAYTTAEWSPGIASDKGARGGYRFDKIRWFKNWSKLGIAYASPNMGGGNFWGVINHDNGEGIFRVADNRVTPGLKMWTWGFESFTDETDVRKEADEKRPYIELWAGVSDRFFESAKFPAKSEVSIPETYSPTVGLTTVTHASERMLANFSAAGSKVSLQFFSMEPDAPVAVTITRGSTVLYNDRVKPDPSKGNSITAEIPADSTGERIQLSIKDSAGKDMLLADVKL
jgi:hypothetical protein